MKKGGFHSYHIGLLLIGAGCMAFGGISQVSADEQRNLAAVISAVSLRPEDRHGDYIKNIERFAPTAQSNLNAAIFDKEIAVEMQQKFNSFNKDYMAREDYRLNSLYDQIRYAQSNRDLVEWTMKKLLQYHFENTLRKSVEEGAKREAQNSKSSTARTAAKAVSTISSVQKALQNTTMNFGTDTKTRFRYDFPSGMMRLALTSPLVDANVEYRLRPTQGLIGAISTGEKLSLGMSRNFEFLKASTNLNYGLVSASINYGVNKHIAGPLSAQVDQAHYIKNSAKDETLFRLNFGTQF